MSDNSKLSKIFSVLDQKDRELIIGDSIFYCFGDDQDFTAKRGVIEKIENDILYVENERKPINIEYATLIIPEPEPIILPLKKDYPLAYIMAVDHLDTLGFKVTNFDGQYGKAKQKIGSGKKTIQWNLEGLRCDYFGNPLESNIALGVKDDWDSRTTFSGYIRSAEDLKIILHLTR